MGHPKRAFWATPMTDPTMGPHSADWCCCSAKCARCRNRSDIYDKTWQNCHRLSEYESWVTKPWPWPLLEKKVGSLHIWHLVCRTFCSSSTLKSEFFVFPLHLHMHMIIWAYFSAHFCASTQDKSVKTLVIDFEVWTCPHFHRRRSLTGRSTLLSVPQVSKPLVSVFIIGLSYGSRNILSYTRCMRHKFLAFRDSPIIPLRHFEWIMIPGHFLSRIFILTRNRCQDG